MASDELAIKLYQAIAEDNETRKYEQFHASNIAECPRAHFYKRLGLEPLRKPSGALVLRWQTGHKIEEVIRPYLLKIYPNLQSNQRLTSDKMNLTGEYDNMNPDTKELIEIKSVHPQAVKYKKVGDTRNHLRDEGPYLHHEWQQHAYVLLLKEQGVEIERITYLYISLSGLLVPYTTEVNPEILRNVKDRIDYLNTCYTAKQLPRCTCNEDDVFWKMTGQYCDYQQEGKPCCDSSLVNKLMESVA